MSTYADLPARRLARASRTIQDAAVGTDLCRFCAAPAVVVVSWAAGRKFLTVCGAHAEVAALYVECARAALAEGPAEWSAPPVAVEGIDLVEFARDRADDVAP